MVTIIQLISNHLNSWMFVGFHGGSQLGLGRMIIHPHPPSTLVAAEEASEDGWKWLDSLWLDPNIAGWKMDPLKMYLLFKMVVFPEK